MVKQSQANCLQSNFVVTSVLEHSWKLQTQGCKWDTKSAKKQNRGLVGSRKANVERLEEERWIGDRRKIVGDELESARISSVSDAAGPPSDFYRTNMRIIKSESDNHGVKVKVITFKPALRQTSTGPTWESYWQQGWLLLAYLILHSYVQQIFWVKVATVLFRTKTFKS